MTAPTREQVNKLLEMIQRHFPSLPMSDTYTDWKKWSEFAQAAFLFGASEARADLEAELETERLRLAAWQPIETAPKDGSEILLCSKKGRIANGTWMTATDRVGAWLWPYIKVEPIYWMPIPAAPKDCGFLGYQGMSEDTLIIAP